MNITDDINILKNFTSSHSFQSYNYCLRMEKEGFDVKIFHENDEYIAVFIPNKWPGWGTLIDTPDINKKSLKTFKEIVNTIDNFCIENKKIIGLRDITPFFYSDLKSELNQELVIKVFDNLGFKAEEKYTILIDLREDLKTLFKELKPESRNKVRRAEKDNIYIEEATNLEKIKIYHNIRSETLKRNKLTPVPLKHFLLNYEILVKAGEMKFFLSFSKDKIPVSGQMAFTKREVIRLAGVCVSDYAITNNLYGNDLMQWHLIEWGHNNGYKWLDFTGCEPYSKDKKLQGIYNFKNRWGGKLWKYYAFSKIYIKWQYHLFNLLKNVKKFYQRFR